MSISCKLSDRRFWTVVSCFVYRLRTSGPEFLVARSRGYQNEPGVWTVPTHITAGTRLTTADLKVVRAGLIAHLAESFGFWVQEERLQCLQEIPGPWEKDFPGSAFAFGFELLDASSLVIRRGVYSQYCWVLPSTLEQKSLPEVNLIGQAEEGIRALGKRLDSALV